MNIRIIGEDNFVIKYFKNNRFILIILMITFAVGIFAGQIKDFLGLDMASVPSEFIEKIKAYAEHITTFKTDTVIVGVISLAILIIMPYVSKVIPGSLIAIIVATLLVKFTSLETSTIGSVYGEL